MPLSESQLETWSHQGSITQSAGTYEAIRRVLLDRGAPYASRNCEVFLQGSYGNDTNIYADSDVDVVVRLTSTYYEDITALGPEDKARRDADWTPAQYGISKFKRDVAGWLAGAFGSGVDPGGKAILVPGGGGRRDADVLACAEFRRYRAYSRPFSSEYEEGLCFWPPGGGRVDNFPKQHSANLTAKHQRTGGKLKRIVRVFKNWRNAMVRDGYLAAGVAPSYFLEGMLWNVPDQLFAGSLQQCCANALAWLRLTDRSALACANDLHWLVRDGLSVCWPSAGFEAFLNAAELHWTAD